MQDMGGSADKCFMNDPIGAFALTANLFLAGLFVAGAAPAQDIHFKTRTIHAGAPTQPGPSDTHQLIQFDHTPGLEDLDALLAAGAQIVATVPDNAVVVSVAGSVVPAGPGILSVTRIDASDKVSPELLSSQPSAVIVEFHPDVSIEQQDAAALAEGIVLQRPAALIANHAVATGSLAALQVLASHDEVAYIFPADPALLTDSGFNACAGMLTLSGPIGQYASVEHGWNMDADHVAHLGYIFESLTPKVSAPLLESEITRALNEWSKVTNVAFQLATSATGARTIAIKFASGAHGDSYPFAGPGGAAAHTFYPVPVNAEPIAGDMHLNADENWNVGGDIDVYSVALHEAGHAIGLVHSDKPGDVMYPYYRRGMSLSAGDIGAAQSLYGVPNAAAPVTLAPISSLAAAPFVLTIDPSPASVQNAKFSVSGIVSGGKTPFSIQWQTDHGYSGTASFTSALGWTTSPISLVNGVNTISVTAFDSADKPTTQTVTVTLTPPSQVISSTGTPAIGPPAISITSPASSVITENGTSMSLSGIATGGAGITKVTWQTSNGLAGTATGTAHWLVSSIPLLAGTNSVVVRAYDASGANAWAAIVAVRN
jgi:hypothetical protein